MHEEREAQEMEGQEEEEAMRRFYWWLVKWFLFLADRDNTLLVHTFVKDDVTEYHVVAERFYPDRHCYGVSEEPYNKS